MPSISINYLKHNFLRLGHSLCTSKPCSVSAYPDYRDLGISLWPLPSSISKQLLISSCLAGMTAITSASSPRPWGSSRRPPQASTLPLGILVPFLASPELFTLRYSSFSESPPPSPGFPYFPNASLPFPKPFSVRRMYFCSSSIKAPRPSVPIPPAIKSLPSSGPTSTARPGIKLNGIPGRGIHEEKSWPRLQTATSYMDLDPFLLV